MPKDVTDRQQRRRAAKAVDHRVMKNCALCGRPLIKQIRRINHLNGIESDNRPQNLIGECHQHNIVAGFVLRRHNLGRRVDLEYKNPAMPARSLAQWVMAVKAMHGESSDMSVKDAIAMVQATPASARSRFAEDIWKIRRARGTDKTAVPF